MFHKHREYLEEGKDKLANKIRYLKNHIVTSTKEIEETQQKIDLSEEKLKQKKAMKTQFDGIVEHMKNINLDDEQMSAISYDLSNETIRMRIHEIEQDIMECSNQDI